MTYLSLSLVYSVLNGLKNFILCLPVFKSLSIQDVLKKNLLSLQYTYKNKPAEQKQARKMSLLRKWQAVLARMAPAQNFICSSYKPVPRRRVK